MMLGALVLGGRADAATIYTYSFTQTGYFTASRPSDITALLSGSFSFSDVPATGIVGKADLIDFSYDFTDYFSGQPVSIVHGGALSDLVSFSYHPGQDGSFLLQARADQTVGTEICVGAAASFGLCGLPTGFNGSIELFQSGQDPDSDPVAFLVTASGPQVTLTSSVTTTPIPAALPLFASCLGALGFVGWRRKSRESR
jgi:hypothetical protein